MTAACLTRTLTSPAETEAFARSLAPCLRGGDTLLLNGPVGAGKTALARAVIGALRDLADLPPEDVPSPTFTLIQTYDVGPVEVWHADLYRLGDPSEVIELGLDDAFETAICLIEWPERLGAATPANAATVTMAVTGDDSRALMLTAPMPMLARLAPAFEGTPA
ncbi:tRNA (adenosine(37)-N6)-threonylcarbamoyltransferase complex ATPase subunit type 1 TsaE [Jannaschia pohangensis]|uniref:tRNA threonylcarbamoyladenosine biosynthesis protein TsaE n=1 Tax=Jannaschia pohangensis TaxID=390807 RepID=A0A1I3TXY0_9RHOB|nr:tRNA (adenosine(37)-N6)-threonylcarbamoyltransferase complex ATPase subunit type 1 TsaE [Jannaschia pohangensis]SFJ75625.1 tRNA threonylcarbamoyladenosine biosynthesis protein TsaE [Jannaschia pohangensis]